MKEVSLDLLKENRDLFKERINIRKGTDLDLEKSLLVNIGTEEKILETDIREEITEMIEEKSMIGMKGMIEMKEMIEMIEMIEEIEKEIGKEIGMMIGEEKKIMIGTIEVGIKNQEIIIRKEGRDLKKVMMI